MIKIIDEIKAKKAIKEILKSEKFTVLNSQLFRNIDKIKDLDGFLQKNFSLEDYFKATDRIRLIKEYKFLNTHRTLNNLSSGKHIQIEEGKNSRLENSDKLRELYNEKWKATNDFGKN